HLVLLGVVPAKLLLETGDGISRLRQRKHAYKNAYMDAPIDAFVLFHPKNLIQTPNQKAFAWQDLLTIKAAIEG
ncbi:MAG: uracil-DNA glycosylase, partial [Alphaproteobacteria bacterium]|nr:uracil-DNA glycosylase [Alphaproteobacteria bacterium]